ncbi:MULTISPECIES: hypothetical protein [unclassified Modestobacter]|uniref:hypothetical protein n=1 Tax=unclassified Modestobacter TaxID=2643866 RepID=UPI0022AA5E55|nr:MULTISPECIES: hypothetical protein [unclassified Modestobacter]MCZ2826054.1 hypothetical protein [Modestobacter sp. VKM Ac-2981]MCZ2852881.1 hypothetical protein [Modestobacter sp. VKM Ac-2982]
MTDVAPDLDALVQAARVAHAQRRSMDAAAAEVLRLLAEADGALPLDGLLAAGAPRDVVAYLVAEDPADKRRKQRARLGFVGGAPVVWLTSTGWQATGRASGREVVPSADSVAHATAPAAIGRWLQQRAATLGGHGITVRATQGAACRRWSAEVTARAWAALRTTGDADGAIGSLTGGLLPDGLIMESFPLGKAGAALHARLRGGTPVDDDDLAETTYTLEVESSSKGSSPLRSKVDRNQAACEQLHAARAVLWVVNTRAVADRLRDLGVDDPRRPSQILVPARDVGLDGEDLGPVRRPWWVTRVPPDEDQSAA